jgi:hypothetical protein
MNRAVPTLRVGVITLQVRVMSEIWDVVHGEPKEREPRDLIAIQDALRLMDTRLATLRLQPSYDRAARSTCYESGLIITGDLVRWVASQRGRLPAENSAGDGPAPFSADDLVSIADRLAKQVRPSVEVHLWLVDEDDNCFCLTVQAERVERDGLMIE